MLTETLIEMPTEMPTQTLTQTLTQTPNVLTEPSPNQTDGAP
jgi:hypothetical protein